LATKEHVIIATVLLALFVTSTLIPFAAAQISQASNQTLIQVHAQKINGIEIPNWIKSIFGYYTQGNMSDNDLIKAIHFLIMDLNNQR
jgi:hypothetical protein